MKKEISPEQKRKDRLVFYSVSSGMFIVVIIICLYMLAMMSGTLIEVADITLDKLDEAKNLTFPANETRRNSLIGQFNLIFSWSGMLILSTVGLLVVAFLSLPDTLKIAWNLHKRRPTMEDRVKLLEMKVKTFFEGRK